MDAVRLHLILAHGATAALVLAGLGGLRYGLRPRLAVQQLLDELALLGALAGLAAWFIGPYALELVGLGLEAPAAARAEAHEDTAKYLPWLLVPLLGVLLGLRFGGSRWQPFRPLAWFLHLLAATGLVYVAALGGAIRHS